MVVFRNGHYESVVNSPELGKWLLSANAEEPHVFDTWGSVKDYCGSSALRPCLLTYRQLEGAAAASTAGVHSQGTQQQQQQGAQMGSGDAAAGPHTSGNGSRVVQQKSASQKKRERERKRKAAAAEQGGK